MSLSIQDFSLLANQLTRIVLEAHVNGILIHPEAYHLLTIFGRQSKEYRTVAVRFLNEGAVSVDCRIVQASLEGLDQLKQVLYTEEILMDRRDMASVLTLQKQDQCDFKPLNLSSPVEVPVAQTKPLIITPQVVVKDAKIPVINQPSTLPIKKIEPKSPVIPSKRPLPEPVQDSSDEDIHAMELNMEADTDEE
jgi:hypothetical protein